MVESRWSDRRNVRLWVWLDLNASATGRRDAAPASFEVSLAGMMISPGRSEQRGAEKVREIGESRGDGEVQNVAEHFIEVAHRLMQHLQVLVHHLERVK
jgi:hypothetical protein